MPISTRLEKTIAKVALLPESEQDVLAEIITREIESENKWDELFAKSGGALEQLGREALQDLKANRATPLDIDRL